MLRRPDIPVAATVIGVAPPENPLDAQPDPAEAARQLLTAGASMEPRLRWIAADVIGLLQEEALPVWREMTAVPGLGPHAKFALFIVGAGPEPDEGEWRWLAVEAVLVMIGKHASDKATAKAARRAAYKASTRRAARR